MGIPRLIPAMTLRLARSLIFSCALATGLSLAAETPPPVRFTAPLDAAWHFRFGADGSTAALAGAVADWPVVQLPHTWNAADGADGGGDYARGAGWYVRRFQVDPTWASRRVYLQFDGANRITTVYLNGKKLGTHAGGFARFRFELTDALQFDGDNLLAVEVNNAEDGLAPVTADFTFFGGLYRNVHLFALDPLHVDVLDHASDGVFVTPGQVTAARAGFSVTVNVRNDSGRAEHAVIRTVVRDAAGATVAAQEQPQEIAAHAAARTAQAFALDHPRLWNGKADPHQYTAEVSVLVDGRVRDQLQQRFGLRSYQVDPDRGFFLNGAYLDLHGVNRHQDRIGKGWAISPADEREDFAMIEEIGATAIRVAHYQQSALWYDLADERGLIVWAEIPVVNEVPATTAYLENAREQLRELIRQNYNRPSICFWGVGNETREGDERPGKPAKASAPDSDHAIAELAKLAHAEDPTRLSTYASHHKADDTRNFHTDVLAFNKYFGWYGGTVADFATFVDDAHRKFPALRFGMSEYGAGANIHQHDLSGTKPTPGGKWHPEEYQAHYHEVYWAAMRTRPFIWGKFIWNMFDFAADIRAEGDAPGMNDKGLVTYDRRTRKDAFYFYKANWNPAPMLYLAGRRFAERPVGATIITVYSNAPRVELLLDGVSLGTVASDTCVFRWNVLLAAGENRVVARAADASGLSDECILTGTVTPTKL